MIEEKIAKCPLCEINIYNRGSKINRPFITTSGKNLLGYPAERAMPCGLNRVEGRCPFETEAEQEKITIELQRMPFISGNNNYQ